MTLSLRNIYPLSEFQRGAKAFLEKLRGTKEPIILTVNGKASVVVQDAQSYQELLDRLELLETSAGIRKSLEEFELGLGIPLDEAFEQLRTKSETSEENGEIVRIHRVRHSSQERLRHPEQLLDDDDE